MFEIEAGVPLPAAKADDRRRNLKYPFHDMEIGSSFLANGQRKMGSAHKAMYAYNHRNKGRRLICREVEGGLRIWRER